MRSCKLTNDCKTLVVAGECAQVAIWDVSRLDAPRQLGEVQTTAYAIYALALSADGAICYACSSHGAVIAIDVPTRRILHHLDGHVDGASCVDLSADGRQLLTGSLDGTLRLWDLSRHQQRASFAMPAQVYSLAISPSPDATVAIGLENTQVQLLDPASGQRAVLPLHESCVLSLRFATSGAWFITTGKDCVLAVWASPAGRLAVQVREAASILCSDVARDGEYIVTGSGDQTATVYKVMYA